MQGQRAVAEPALVCVCVCVFTCPYSSGYVIVAWIWSGIWYMGLDPIKWILCWILNEDGFRNKEAYQEEKKRQIAVLGGKAEEVNTGMAGRGRAMT